MKQKNVLVIAYYFPPSGGPGVQRVLKHVQYLKQFGWNPIVLTVSNGQFPARDESLLEHIPKDVLVVRTKIFEPYDLYRLLTGKKKGTSIDVNVIKKDDQKISWKEKLAEWIRATFFIPDARIGWRFSAISKGLELIKEHNIEAIYSSSPPYTCSIIARSLKKKTGLRWVAGFRDPWTGFISSPKRWFLPSAIDKHMEFSTFNEADAVECAWEGIIKDALEKYPSLDKSKFFHVPNGYDSADFPKEIDTAPTSKFTITYTGSLYGRRNPKSLFEALEIIFNKGIISPIQCTFRFIGRFGAEVEEMFQSVSFPESLEIHGYMSHEESIRYLFKSDVLLLIVDESKESAEIVPGKVYEYLGVLKPILAIAPHDGAIASLIRETDAGAIAHQTEVENIVSIIEEYFHYWQNKTLHQKAGKKEVIERYERKESTKKLASLLQQ